MKFFFPENDLNTFLSKANIAVNKSNLQDLISLQTNFNQLIIIVSKFGTSKFVFNVTPNNSGLEFELKSEKVALTHAALRSQAIQKLEEIVEQTGGKILSH